MCAQDSVILFANNTTLQKKTPVNQTKVDWTLFGLSGQYDL